MKTIVNSHFEHSIMLAMHRYRVCFCSVFDILSACPFNPSWANTFQHPSWAKGGGVIEPPFYLSCLPTDLDDIFTQCHG